MVSKAKIQANARYNVKAYDVLQCRIAKSEHINDLIAAAVRAGHDTSKAAYVLNAVKARLRQDGVITDDQ